MRRTFHLLESKDRNSLLTELEELVGKGWNLESFNVVVINKAAVFYALMSNTQATAAEERILEEELEGLKISKKGNSSLGEEKGKYQI